MSKLLMHAKDSSLMDINIQYGEETVRFNLFKEVKIKKVEMRGEILTQPQIYAFLSMLQKKFELYRAELEIRESRAWAKALKKWKGKTNPKTGRPFNEDYCNSMVELDKDYNTARKKKIAVIYDLGRINACVRAFEQRKDLIQTLSANERSEKRV